jgi:hypothetical protein
MEILNVQSSRWNHQFLEDFVVFHVQSWWRCRVLQRTRQGTENDLTLPDLWPRLRIDQGPVDRCAEPPGCPGCSKVSAPMRQLPPVALPRHFQGAPSSEKITGSVGFYGSTMMNHKPLTKKKKLRGFFSKWRTSQFVSCISEQVVARLGDGPLVPCSKKSTSLAGSFAACPWAQQAVTLKL